MRQRIAHGSVIDAVTTEELQQILKEFSRAGHYALGADTIERDLRDWPVEGHDRRIAVNRSHGGEIALGANAYVDVVPQENGRGGISISNIGANPCFIYLTDANKVSQQNGVGVPTRYLPAGAIWEGEISKETWIGPISVKSVLGTTIVWGAI